MLAFIFTVVGWTFGVIARKIIVDATVLLVVIQFQAYV
jgi:hypothetical protein